MGVHSGKVELSGKVYRSGIIVRPMHRELPKLEAYIIGYSGNAYGQKAVFIIEKFLRPYKNFKTKEELLKQIRKDIKKC